VRPCVRSGVGTHPPRTSSAPPGMFRFLFFCFAADCFWQHGGGRILLLMLRPLHHRRPGSWGRFDFPLDGIKINSNTLYDSTRECRKRRYIQLWKYGLESIVSSSFFNNEKRQTCSRRQHQFAFTFSNLSTAAAAFLKGPPAVNALAAVQSSLCDLICPCSLALCSC
jgi:hypothetical protein